MEITSSIDCCLIAEVAKILAEVAVATLIEALLKLVRSDDELFNLYSKTEDVDINKFPLVDHTYLNLSYKHLIGLSRNSLKFFL